MGWRKALAPFKEAFVRYNEQLLKIFLCQLIYTFPIFLFVSSGSILGIQYLGQENGTLLILYVNVLGFWLSQIPFIYMVRNTENGLEITLQDIFLSIKKNITSVYIVGLLGAFCVTLGYHFFILPGLICLILFMLFPQVSVMEGGRYRGILKKALHIGSTHFLYLLNLILFFVMVDWWLLWAGKSLLSVSGSSYVEWIVVQGLIQAGVLPYVTFVLSLFYAEKRHHFQSDSWQNPTSQHGGQTEAGVGQKPSCRNS